MDNIKKIIIALVILIIVVIIILLCILNKDNINSEENVFGEISFDETMTEVNNTNFSIVKINSEYYGIAKIIGDFCEYTKIIYNEGYLDEETSDEEKLVYQNMILDMFSSKYKSEFDIDNNNLEEYVSCATESDYIINSMYYSIRENKVCIYLVYGQFGYTGDEYNFMIVVDLTNNAYEMYLNEYIEKYGYTEENIQELEIENNNIGINDNNKYTLKDYTEQEMAQKYLSNYKEILANNLEKAYNLLYSEYRMKRFEDYNEFSEYYNLRKAYIQSCTLEKYKVSNNGSYTQYMCIDNYNNYYVFSAEGVMKYSVQLDEYTILPDDFIESYNKATDEQKVQTNIETFFKMINTKDYKAAYNVLDDTFKANNFSTLEEFKEYAQNHFFDNTTITSVVDLSKTGTYYACTINTSSGISTAAETGEETFIVSLGDGTDFTMSFTVK